jgi:Uma2 family endonuclease
MTSAAVPIIPPGPIKLTIDEYMELPNDGKRYQILDGELNVTPAPNTRHQRISKRLERVLLFALEETGLGEIFYAPVDVILDGHNILQPDLVFVCKERMNIIGPANIQGAPDLVIEILSQSTRRTDVLVKSEIYARFGVPSYWIVDPEIDRIDLYNLASGTYQLAQTASAPSLLEPQEFPGFKLELREIFA